MPLTPPKWFDTIEGGDYFAKGEHARRRVISVRRDPKTGELKTVTLQRMKGSGTVWFQAMEVERWRRANGFKYEKCGTRLRSVDLPQFLAAARKIIAAELRDQAIVDSAVLDRIEGRLRAIAS